MSARSSSARAVGSSSAIALDLTGALRRDGYRLDLRVADAFLAPLAAFFTALATFLAGARLAGVLAGARLGAGAFLPTLGSAAMAASTASRLSSSTASTSSAGADS